jgi:hypothetical protein
MHRRARYLGAPPRHLFVWERYDRRATNSHGLERRCVAPKRVAVKYDVTVTKHPKPLSVCEAWQDADAIEHVGHLQRGELVGKCEFVM